METRRISLDVTNGTFTRIGALCQFQKKSEFLRELVDERIKKEEYG